MKGTWLKDAGRKLQETGIKQAFLKPKMRYQTDPQTDRISSPAKFPPSISLFYSFAMKLEYFSD